MADGGELSGLTGWGSKLPANVARIALNFALFEGGPEIHEVGAECTQSAVALGQQLIPHAVSVLNSVQQDPIRVAAKNAIIDIYREDLTKLTRRMVMRQNRTLDVRGADDVLRLLEEHGYIARIFEEPQRGRPSERYSVRPGLA